MQASTLTTTRRQLRGYGASGYLARRLTESLEPVAKSGNAYVYTLEQVAASVREYSAHKRIQSTTKQVLEQMLTQLLALIDNVVPMAPNDSKTEVSGVAQQLLEQMHRTDKALANMKATVASIGERTR